jgi:FMN-dependent NADH-azoreductase
MTMTNILQINASIQADKGQSSQLAGAFTAALRGQNPGAGLVVRNLARDPVPHLDAERFGAFLAKPADRTPEQRAIVAYSDALIDQLRLADVIVLGLPMYNFGVPSQLKAWFDHVARAGETFRYTETGPEGLLKGKKAYVFAARGGLYAGTPKDTQTGYVRDFLGFLGITDVQFTFAEGLAISEASRIESLASAHARIRTLTEAAAVPVEHV